MERACLAKPYGCDDISHREKNRSLLKNRPQCRHHGDYHEGNMIFSESGELFVIDWHTVDFDNYGDPWYEFNRIGSVYPAFASGQIDGYFQGKPPEDSGPCWLIALRQVRLHPSLGEILRPGQAG